MDFSIMKKSTIELIKLTASDGMTLTNGETYSKEIYLGVNDSVDNWREIPDSEVPEITPEEIVANGVAKT